MKFSRKKFLVTGGAGFLGSAIANRLHYKNSKVIILDDFSIGQKDNIIFQCDIIKGNVADDDWMHKIHDVDYILHFAAPSSVVLFKKSPNKCLLDTVVGITNVFEYAIQHGVKKVVYPSSSSVYGNTSLPQSETTDTMPCNLYGVAKLTCEHIARLYSDVLPSVGLRIFAGYGPGERHKGNIASVITLFTEAILRSSQPIIFGDGTQSRDFIYVDDIVEVVLRSIENSFSGIVNVGSGESHTFNEVVGLLNHLLGKNIRPRYVDKPAQYFEHTLADITKMKNVLEFSPMSFEDGLKKYLEAKEELFFYS